MPVDYNFQPHFEIINCFRAQWGMTSFQLRYPRIIVSNGAFECPGSKTVAMNISCQSYLATCSEPRSLIVLKFSFSHKGVYQLSKYDQSSTKMKKGLKDQGPVANCQWLDLYIIIEDRPRVPRSRQSRSVTPGIIRSASINARCKALNATRASWVDTRGNSYGR
jgi:hypothetical protein